MSFIKRFKINGLDKKAKFEETITVVLNSKLQKVKKEIDKFFKDDSTKNLHNMRIAFRRFRYTLEIYYDCLPPRLFKRIYTLVEDLQDKIGIARDLDVIEDKILSTSNKLKLKTSESLIKKFEEEKLIARQNIKPELIKFISDKDINKLKIKRRPRNET